MIKIEVTASASKGRGQNKLYVLECQKINESGIMLGYKYINAQVFKDKGIIKKFPGFKAVQEYLNTEEGLKFYEEAQHTPFN